MHRSIIPFIMACLGITLVALARDMPLFDWEISKVVADFPPNFYVKQSPWTTRLGESVLDDSLDNGAYFLWQVYTPMGDKDVCSPIGLKPDAKFSKSGEFLERISANLYHNVFSWSSQEIIFGPMLLFCGIYIWWFTIWYKRPISEATIFTVLIVIVFCFLQASIWRVLRWRVMPALACAIFTPPHPYSGTFSFSARLLGVHFEMLAVLLIGVCLEVGAVVVILSQIRKAIIQRKESAKSAVG